MITKEQICFNHNPLSEKIERFGRNAFSKQAGISEARLIRLLCGECDFRHEEIRAASRILHLSAEEIKRYFFTPKVQKF